MSTRGLNVPPSRAGRLWLQRRLATAQRGADLLDRKLRILRTELGQVREAAARTAADWQHRQAEAEAWLIRAALLGGQRAIRLASDGGLADVTVGYAVTMGIRYPASATCAIPSPETWDGPALAGARKAHRAALDAAVRHAVAAEAVRLIEAETLATQHRLRAIKERWLPRLEQALADVTLAIEELERADAARLRLAARSSLPSAGR